MTLREKIAHEIRRDGPIPFSRYMEICLYEPGLGYYARPREQFGKAGDFYTSSDVHAVFGRLLCRNFDEMWRAMGSPAQLDLIELGPGRGLFAADVLDWGAKKFPDFFAAVRYRLVEVSEHSRARLQERLAGHIASGRARVYETWTEAGNDCGQHVIVFGNEFFDALPVDVISDLGSVRVGVNEAGFVETFAPASTDELAYLDRYSVHPERGQRVEAQFAGADWMRRITEALADRTAFLVFIDYGYTREEQLRGRHLDTIVAYRQHSATNNPYEAPGEQDITAHVNFTMLEKLGQHYGFRHDALLTQSEFLIGIGEQNEFTDAFEDCKLPQERAKVALQLKHLVTPTGMGETFHVLVMSQGVEKEKAARLSGLKFAR